MDSITEPAHGATAAAQVRPLDWGRFILQFATVMAAFLGGAAPAILLLGPTSVGLALSTLCSMVAAVGIAWLWLRSDNAVAIAFDLSRPPSWPRTILVGIAATVAIFLMFVIGAPLVGVLGLQTPDVSDVLGYVVESPWTFLMWIVLIAWLSAGLGEELLWRGFMMDRLARLPGLRGSPAGVVVVQAAIFGLPHLYQGWGGVVITGTIGLFLGWLRLRMRGNLWAPVIAHAAVDTIMLSLGYADSLGWYQG